MSSILKKTGKITGYTLLALLLLVLVLLVSLRIPAVQTFIAQKATSILAEKTGGRLSVEKVRIDFVDNVQLRGLYAEDLSGDTLLYAGLLDVDISLWALISQEVNIDNVTLENATGKLKQDSAGTFNFQYIIDAFASADTTQDTTSSAWTVSVDDVNLSNIDFTLDMPYLYLNTRLTEVELSMDQLDLQEQIIAVDELLVNESFTSLQIKNTGTAEPDTVSVNDSIITYPLPDIGWTISANKLSVGKTGVDLDMVDEPLKEDQLDPNHLHVRNVNINLEDFEWKGKRMAVDVKGITASETNSGYAINSIKGQLMLDTTAANIEGLQAKIANSQLNLSAAVQYPNFNGLVNLSPELEIEAKIEDTYISPEDLRKYIPGFDTLGILNPDFTDKIFLNADVQGKLADIEPSTISVNTGKHTQAQIQFSAQGLPEYDKATYNITLEQVHTSYADLRSILGDIGLPKGLQHFGLVKLDGKIDGRLSDLNAQGITLSTQTSTGFTGSIQAKGLPHIDTTHFVVDIAEATTSAEDIEALIDTVLPPEVKRLDTVMLTGSFRGTIKDMALDATVTTGLGKVIADASAQFNSDYSYASYDGDVQVEGFDLGAMLDNPDLGILSLNITAKGAGLQPATIDAALDASVKKFSYKGYNYQNIEVHGQMDSMQFEGKISIDDPNLRFDFDGLVGLRDSTGTFSFTASLDTVDLQALNLSKTPAGLSTRIQSDIKGTLPDDFEGSLKVMDFNASTGEEDHYQMDSLVVDAYDSTGGLQVVRITSPIINGAIAGHYDFQTLPAQLIDYVNSFVLNLETDTTQQISFDVEQNFELLLTVSDLKPLTKIFAPQLRLDTATITGAFNSLEKQLNLDVNVPYIEYNTINLGPLLVQAEGTAQKLVSRVYIDSLNVGENISIPSTRFRTGIFNDSLKYDLVITEDSAYTALDVKGRMVRNGEEYLFHLIPRLILNNETWAVSQGNQIAIKPGYLRVDNFSISHENQQVTLKSQVLDNENRPLSLSFKNFQIQELSDLIDYEGLDMAGSINGRLTLKDIRTNLDFTGDLEIQNITVNENPVGNLDVDATSQGELIDVAIQMTGSQNDLEVAGTINTDAQTMNLTADIQKLQLKLMDPFLQQYIAESEGYISLKATIKGGITEPNVNGYLAFNNLSTISKINGERYNIKNNKINFNSTNISINSLKLEDSQQNQLTVNGNVSHDRFRDIRFNLDVNTDEFRLWNTRTRDDQIFYGTVILGLQASVTGPIDLPVVNANVITREGTEVYVEPLALEESITEEDYILFRQPKRDSLNRVVPDTVTDEQYKVQISGIDLTLNFELTDDAKLQIIIDPTTGDSLTTYGSANLTVRVPPVGDVEITGTYTIDRGSYRLSYQNLLRKQFALVPGGTISFTGDPLQARLNIAARYTTEVTTYELVSTESAGLTDTEIRETQDKQPVNVLLSINGDLSAPELSFDIKMEESNVGSVVSRKLAQIRQDQSELNKQVFALLVLNSFIAEESTGSSNLGTTGSNVALRSVSNLITQQLNKLAGKAKGLSINFNLDSYQSKYETATGNNTVTEIGLDISKTFFNDRLEISAGTDVNLQSDVNTEQSDGSFTQLAGDFILEYKITESGRYRVQVFNKTDYDALNQSNVNKTGVGFTYKQSFGNVLKKNRKKEEDKKKKEEATDDNPKKEEETENNE